MTYDVMRPRRLAGRTALVSGAGGGIGRASAIRLASEGAHVAVVDIKVEAAQTTVDLIAADTGKAFAIGPDVRKPSRVTAMVENALRITGHPLAIDGGMVAQ